MICIIDASKMFSHYKKLHVSSFKRNEKGKDNSQLNTNNLQKGIKIYAQIVAAILIIPDNLSLLTIYILILCPS